MTNEQAKLADHRVNYYGCCLAGILAAFACAERELPPPHGAPDQPMAHTTLGASFVSGDSAVLRRLLHPALIVQPPPPDSALRGDAAIEYLLKLAAVRL